MRYSLKQIITSAKSPDSWLGVSILNTFNFPLLYVIANYTSIRPEVINLGSFLLGILMIFQFLQGTPQSLLLGALFYLFSWICDGLDGKLARLKNQVTGFGGVMDRVRDKVVHLGGVLSLVIGQANHPEIKTLTFLGFLYLLFLFINSFLAFLISKSSNKFSKQKKDLFVSSSALSLLPTFHFFYIKTFPFPSATEWTFLLFFVAPLTGYLKEVFLFVIPLIIISITYLLFFKINHSSLAKK